MERRNRDEYESELEFLEERYNKNVKSLPMQFAYSLIITLISLTLNMTVWNMCYKLFGGRIQGNWIEIKSGIMAALTMGAIEMLFQALDTDIVSQYMMGKVSSHGLARYWGPIWQGENILQKVKSYWNTYPAWSLKQLIIYTCQSSVIINMVMAIGFYGYELYEYKQAKNELYEIYFMTPMYEKRDKRRKLLDGH